VTAFLHSFFLLSSHPSLLSFFLSSRRQFLGPALSPTDFSRPDRSLHSQHTFFLQSHPLSTNMINGFSKAIALYLAPLLSLTSLILTVLAFIAPTITLSTQVALLIVGPKTSEEMQGEVDGPRVWMGVIGSCSRSNNDAKVFCTASEFTPHYGMCLLLFAMTAPLMLAFIRPLRHL
jgi:hypothetical protein